MKIFAGLLCLLFVGCGVHSTAQDNHPRLTKPVIPLFLKPKRPGSIFQNSTHGNVYMAVIGDSISAGYSATTRCFPSTMTAIDTTCGTATDYVSAVAKALETQTGPNTLYLQNLGFAGASTFNLTNGLEIPSVDNRTNLIILEIGTNDASYIFRVIGNTQTSLSAFQSNYLALLNIIQNKFPLATIVLVNVYNDNFFYCCTSNALWQTSSIIKQVDSFIDSFYPQYPVVDWACDTRIYSQAADDASSIHPSDLGHSYLAQDVLNTIYNPQPPQKVCGPYGPNNY